MKILLVGGSKSGKSLMAQSLCRKLSAGKDMIYWATMEPTDTEDLERIARHLRERDGWGFDTVEYAKDLDRGIVSPEATVLFDSVTALMANEMFSGPEPDENAGEKCTGELLRLSDRVKNFVCVADDVWRDGFVFDGITESYRRGMALTCRALAKEFDTVYEVTCGIPKIIKGEKI